ncbi:SH3 domain-containing protein [Streptococcus gallolyticus subsp. gallolyticus]|uniref:DUF6287 domain-containing protein n=1 Tax=Streptococcus gallolyticus TaxID=315405 RepID=UPI002283418A|nr:DUF6287 domain-containing protein [Streptococcus gallolyticus]MCY7201701.1 SH3 domain-containing protein [Streptococcus gallolyticus subsp. gallolyticus]
MKKLVLFFSCLLLVGCHQESNNTKTTQSSERIQTSSSSNIPSQEESKDYSEWYLNYKYYYVQSNTSSLMVGGLSLNNDGTAILYRSGAELMAYNQGSPLIGTYTIEEYKGSDSIQTYVTSGNMTVNGEEPSRTAVMPRIKVVINISSENIERLNGTAAPSENQTEVLYGYSNDEGNKVLTTGEGNESTIQVYFHGKPNETEYVVNVDEVNLRSKPSLNSDIIDSRRKGDIIQVSDCVNGDKYNDVSSWWEVSVDGKICYVWSGALQIKSAYNYEQQSVNDIDLSAISKGNYESLVGTWRNGKGDTLVIHADGSVVSTVSGRIDEESLGGTFRYESDGIPYIGMSNGYTGGLIALLKIGFKTAGDNSDTSKPRIVPTQNGVYNLPSDVYYYRQ